jgi:hypothetical protein
MVLASLILNRCEGSMPQTAIDVDQWLAALRADHRLNANAKVVAHTLAQHFRRDNGCVQMSFERIANDAGFVSLASLRNALASLRLSGWITSERIGSTARHGMVYRPLMPEQVTTQHAPAA